MGPVFELDLDLPKRGSRQRTRSLHQQLRLAIIEGRLKAGVRLPGSRALASQVAMTRNAVVAVYDLLLSEGYVTTRRGGGTYVAQIASSRRPAKPAPQEFDQRLATA